MKRITFTPEQHTKLIEIYELHGYVRKYYTGFGCRPETCIKYLKRLYRYKRSLKESSL